jgi:hypothetical protein
VVARAADCVLCINVGTHYRELIAHAIQTSLPLPAGTEETDQKLADRTLMSQLLELGLMRLRRGDVELEKAFP